MGRGKYRRGRDPNGQHVRIYHHLLKSPAWIALSSSAMRLFLDMRMKLTSFNNGNIEAVYSELKHRGWNSRTTLYRALRELEGLGFIERTRQGGIASMSRICSLYRFTDLETLEISKLGLRASKATNEYRRFKSVREARTAVREAEAVRRSYLKGKKEKVKVQNPAFTGPASAPIPLPLESSNVRALSSNRTETGPMKAAAKVV